MSLKRTCDFCVRRKRSCDGFAKRRCSFCIAKNQPVCYYQSRRPRKSRTSGCDVAATEVLPPTHSGGRSFGQAGGDIAPAFTEGDRRSASADSGSGDECISLPLKRGRFSPSPATGLIGLQENDFLGDFFGCLGFLSLASESTVRGAMVEVMIAGASTQHEIQREEPSPSHSSPGLVEKHAAGVRHAVGESTDDVGDSAWSSALEAETGPGALPRDPSTCALWCAIALGALVKGTPLDHVRRYVELAQGSLRACSDGATLGTARAYVAMAVLFNFLGHQVKSHEYVKLANSIAEALPPEEIPRGFRELLQYAGFAWAIETELASADDANGYWKNVPPIWELSESVLEQDVCGFVLSLILHLFQPFFYEASAGHMSGVKQQQQQPSTPAPAPPRAPIKNPDLQDAEEADRVFLDNAKACGDVQKKSVLPEMLRISKCIETSPTRFGLGGLLYYGNLAYLQLLNNEPAVKVSFKRCLDVLLRYPGLCRYNVWAHSAHCKLNTLAMIRSRHEYEALRAAYNSVRPGGSPPAPPFEEWRGMSDVCDHACCRRTAMHMQCLFKDYLRAKSKRRAPVTT